MHAKRVLYIRNFLRTLQAGIENINPQIKSLSRLLRKSLRFFLRDSTVGLLDSQDISCYAFKALMIALWNAIYTTFAILKSFSSADDYDLSLFRALLQLLHCSLIRIHKTLKPKCLHRKA